MKAKEQKPQLNIAVVSRSADDIVKMLADWSNRYPRGRVYPMSKMSMDDELIEIEKLAKDYVLEHCG